MTEKVKTGDRQMSHSDYMLDDEFRLTKKSRRSLERHRKKGADSSDRAEVVLYAELVDRGCVTLGNLDYLAAELLDRYGGAEEAIEALRSGRVRFHMVSEGGTDDRGLQITLPDPDENDVLLVFFVDPEDDDSLVDFLYSLLEIYGDEGEDIAAKVLGPKAFTRAICGGLVREGKLVRVGEHYRLAEH
jgi:hypothetical protein